jgi:heme oxygenase
MLSACEPGVSSVIDALRQATRSRHAKIEAIPAMARLFDADYTLSEYRQHLGRLLGLFEPLERAVADVTGADHPVRDLQRSSALVRDLHNMGLTSGEIGSLERYGGLWPIEPASIHGYSYVVLGSMMGAKIIVKRLRAVLGPEASFCFYGDENGRSQALWASFCSDLEKTEQDNVPKICATAVAIFDAYEEWLSAPVLAAGSRP